MRLRCPSTPLSHHGAACPFLHVVIVRVRMFAASGTGKGGQGRAVGDLTPGVQAHTQGTHQTTHTCAPRTHTPRHLPTLPLQTSRMPLACRRTMHPQHGASCPPTPRSAVAAPRLELQHLCQLPAVLQVRPRDVPL